MKLKRIIGLLLALAVMLSTGLGYVGASAAGTGKITVTNAEKDKSYSIYKVFDLTQSGTNVAYTIAPAWKTFFTSGDGAAYIVANNNAEGTLNAIVVDGVVKYINITDANVAAFADAVKGQIGTITPEATKKADANGSLVFDQLDLGYYLVNPEGATAIADGQKSIVSLTSTTPEKEIISKGTYPTVKKEATVNNADIGGKVSYKITTKVPDTKGFKTYKFDVKDTFSKGLTFAENLKVTIGGNEVNANFSYAAGDDPDSDGTLLTIKFDMMQFQDKIGQEVVITYDATINKNAVVGNEGNPNEVYIEYSNDPKDSTKTEKTPPDKEKVYTGKVIINKVDKKNNETKLEGAEFVVKNEAGKFYKYDETEGKVTWVDSVDQATKKTTDKQGAATFEGLKAGKYYLKETKAPEGYNLLTNEIEFVLTATGETVKMEATSKVENSAGVELPGTGGTGTKIFALMGGAIIVYAAFSLIKGRLRFEGR